jgi:hypothetical protein
MVALAGCVNPASGDTAKASTANISADGLHSASVTNLPSANIRPLSAEEEGAVAEATIETLDRVGAQGTRSVGAIFVSGMSTNIVRMVSERVGAHLPPLMINLSDFDPQHWSVRRTRKPAILLTVHRVSSGGGIQNVEIFVKFYREGGAMYYVEVKRQGHQWRVFRVESGID